MDGEMKLDGCPRECGSKAINQVREVLGALWDIADRVGWICAIFESHEYPEIEALPVVKELRELLKKESIRWFMVWGGSIKEAMKKEAESSNEIIARDVGTASDGDICLWDYGV